MSVGLRRGFVRLERYDSNWPVEFEQEKQRLLDALGERIIAIEHIGSTSVPGLPAKPIIDMIVAIRSFDDLRDFIEPLGKLGYEYMPERMFAGRKFFPRGPRSQRTHHLNLVLKDDPEQWMQPLLFRDYLHEHEATRDKYARLKASLAEKYSNDRETYTKSKNGFIQKVLQIASNE